MKLIASFIILIMGCGVPTHSRSSGAPSGACSTLTPNHPGSPQLSTSPYSIDLSVFNLYNDSNFFYVPGGTYQVTLSGGTFRGFLIQARLVSGDTTLVGSFSMPPTGTRLSSCNPSQSAITHNTANDKTSITATWTAPPRGSGSIRFRFAVVQTYNTYWADQSTDILYEAGTYLQLNDQTMSNNSRLDIADVGEGSAGILCVTDSQTCCTNASNSQWYSPDGVAVQEGSVGATNLYVTRAVGYLSLNRITGGASGLYLCDVPDQTGTRQLLYIGLYDGSPSAGMIESIEISFELRTAIDSDQLQFTLVCQTQGGPATAAVWERNGADIMDDGNFTTSQIVVDAVSATYNNTLLVSSRLGGQYTCTVTNDRGSMTSSLNVEVASAPSNIDVVQVDLTATSIRVKWRHASSSTANEFQVIYNTEGESRTLTVPYCAMCEIILSGLIKSASYNISIVTLSDHLPSTVLGPANVDLVTGCVELGYTDCCIPNFVEEFCIVDLPGTSDCYCDNCYTFEGCCPDILSTCTPPSGTDLCKVFRGYECDIDAQCVSFGDDPTNSTSYQCVCNQGFIGNGNTTCIASLVVIDPVRVLATNGSSGYEVTCLAPSFVNNSNYWILIGAFNVTVANETILQLPELGFEDAGANYQCVVETEFGNIFSDQVEILVSPEGSVQATPAASTGERGTVVTFECSALGGPRNTFSWTHVSTQLMVSSNQVLTVNVTRGVDGGAYRCMVENTAGDDSAESIIYVTPFFEVSPASTGVQLGSNVTLNCSADGYPAPSIEWVHFDAVITNSDVSAIEEVISNTVVTSTLTAMNIDTSNFGQYYCRARTSINESVAIESEHASVSLSGTLPLDVCAATYNLTEEMGNLTVATTGTVCLLCIYNGSVDTNTAWTYNNMPVSTVLGTEAEGVLVLFTAAQAFIVDAATEIVCTGPSTYQYSILVRVLQAPVVPSVIDIEEGTDGSVTCDSSGSIPVTSHVWSSANGTVLSTSSTLTLPGISRNQAGVYTCTIQDDMGNNVTGSTIINVQHLPSVVASTLSPHFVLVEQQLHLYCSFDGIPDPTVVWIQNGSAINTTEPRISVLTNATYSQITLENVTLSDSGLYICNITNTIGNAQTSITVNAVDDLPVPLTTIEDAGSNTAGQSYTLTCMATLVEGLSITPDIQWMGPNGSYIVGDGSITISDLELVEGVVASRSLTFSVLLTSHGGEYTCRANLSLPGSSAQHVASNETFNVTVQIPSPDVSITSPLQAVHEGTFQVLTCTATVHNAVDTNVVATFEWLFGGSVIRSESGAEILQPLTAQLAFQSNLTFNPITLSNGGDYFCTARISNPSEFVETGKGNTSTTISVSATRPLIEISDSGGRRAGRVVSLTCTVTVVEGLVATPYVEFVNSSGGILEHPMIQVRNPGTQGRVTMLTLLFNPLITSLGGEYVCVTRIDLPQISIHNISFTSTVQVVVAISTPTVIISPHNDIGAPLAGFTYSLVCNVAVNSTYVDTEIEAVVMWISSHGQVMTGGDRVSVSPLQEVDGAYVSNITFSPLSLNDADYACTAEINPGNSSTFVSASNAETSNFTLTAMVPPLPNVSVSAVGSGVAGEELQLICTSKYPKDILGTSTVAIQNEAGQVVGPIEVMSSDGRVEGTVVLTQLRTSDSGSYMCLSGYSIPEAGLDSSVYFTNESTTITVSIPPPMLTIEALPNITYVGTQTSLNCNLQLPPVVDTAVLVNSSWTRLAGNSSTRVEELLVISLGNNLYRSTITVSPLKSSDAGNYTCSYTIEAESILINGTNTEATYALVPVDLIVPSITILPNRSTVLGTSVVLSCIVTVVDGLVGAPTVEWVVNPGNTTVAEQYSVEESVYRRDVTFNPLQSTHGGIYVCRANINIPTVSIPPLLNSYNYTLKTQVPPPSIVITQNPQDQLITGQALLLLCFVSFSQSVDIEVSISVAWIEADGLDVQNSTNGRIVVTEAADMRNNDYEKLLSIAPISRELDDGHNYSCSARVSLLELIEYVTAENGVERVSVLLDVQDPPEPVVGTAAANTIPAPGQRYTLNCTVSVMDGLVIPPLVQWLSPNGAPITIGEEFSIVEVTAGNVTLSSLLFAGITGEQAGTYICVGSIGGITSRAEVNVTIQTPPAMFQVTNATQTSLSFTWSPPVITGPVLNYTLSCTTTLPGVSQPAPLQIPESNATLYTLSPGVLYTCSVTATTERETSLAVTLSTSTVETAPTGPPLNVIATPTGPRDVTILWDSPEPHLRNGIILHYSIQCPPRPLVIVQQAGPVTVTGFTPFTSYNCSLTASNSAGEGPPSYDDVMTEDETGLFQLRLLGLSDCHQWLMENADGKRSDVSTAVEENINQRCGCDFPKDNILKGAFQCFDSDLQAVTFRALIRGLQNRTSANLLGSASDWVASGPTISVLSVRFNIDSDCPAIIETLSDPECHASSSESSSGLSSGAVGGIAAAGALAVVVIAVGIVAVVICMMRKRHSTNVKLKNLLTSSTASGQPDALLLSARNRNMSVDSGILTYNEPQTTDFPYISNPQYGTKKDFYEVPTPPELRRLPQIPTEDEEDGYDGYAMPSVVLAKHRENTRRPSEYLEPLTPSTDALCSPTVLTNKSSGLYDDPDYTVSPSPRLPHKLVLEEGREGEREI